MMKIMIKDKELCKFQLRKGENNKNQKKMNKKFRINKNFMMIMI